MFMVDVALAFALTMLGVASLVSLALKAIQTVSTTRTETFKRLLIEYKTKELEPVIMRELKRLSHDAANQGIAALESATQKSEALEQIISNVASGQDKRTRLNTDDLIEMIKRSDYGHALLSHLGNRSEEVFDALGQRFEALGRKYSESYRSRTRLWATGVAFVVAVVVNVDSIHVVSSFLKNKALRESVVANVDTVLDHYKKNVEPNIGTTTTPATARELKRSLGATRDELALLRSSVLPIGLQQYPHAGLLKAWTSDSNGDAEPETDDPTKPAEKRSPFLWFLGILTTAVLAGLGAPFWFDTIRGIRRLSGGENSKRS